MGRGPKASRPRAVERGASGCGQGSAAPRGLRAERPAGAGAKGTGQSPAPTSAGHPPGALAGTLGGGAAGSGRASGWLSSSGRSGRRASGKVSLAQPAPGKGSFQGLLERCWSRGASGPCAPPFGLRLLSLA